jgi:hypothetical protein
LTPVRGGGETAPGSRSISGPFGSRVGRVIDPTDATDGERCRVDDYTSNCRSSIQCSQGSDELPSFPWFWISDTIRFGEIPGLDGPPTILVPMVYGDGEDEP